MCAGYNSQQGWALYVQDYTVSLYGKKNGILSNLANTGAGAKRAAHQKLTCQPAALSDHLTSDLQQLKAAASPEEDGSSCFGSGKLQDSNQNIPTKSINCLLFHN